MSWKSNVSVVMAGLLALLSAACSQDTHAETAIALSIKSDLVAGQELGSVRVRIYEVGVNPDTATAMLEFLPQPAAELARPTVVLKGSRTEVLIVVQGLDLAGNAVVIARTRAQFMDGKTYNLPIQLAKACKAKNCGEIAGQTCYGEKQDGICEGTCGPIPVGVSAGLIEDEDSPLPTASREPTRCGPPDSGPPVPVNDGGPQDAGTDADTGTFCKPSMAGASCNLVTQCGCGAGESCGVEKTTTTATVKCVTPGTVREGMFCSKDEQCAAGLLCVGASCSKFCEVDSDCGANGACASVSNSATSTQRDYKVCGDSCTSNAGCPLTGCCMNDFCAPAAACNVCKTAGQTCTASTDCCMATPYCTSSTAGATTGTCSATKPATTPASCMASSTDTACGSCNKSKCCTPRDACVANTSCVNLNVCLNACAASDTACATTCASTYPSGVSLLNTWSQCQTAQCGTQCM